jgi:hypothetical protein
LLVACWKNGIEIAPHFKNINRIRIMTGNSWRTRIFDERGAEHNHGTTEQNNFSLEEYVTNLYYGIAP